MPFLRVNLIRRILVQIGDRSACRSRAKNVSIKDTTIKLSKRFKLIIVLQRNFLKYRQADKRIKSKENSLQI